MPANILQLAIAGDRNALNHLLEKHRDLAFSVALKYINNTADAEDIIQNAFIKVFLNIGKFRHEAAFSTWLYKIIYFEAIRFMSKQQRIRTIEEEVKDQAPVEENANVFPNERGLALKNAMICLSANEYLVMNLFYLLEKEITEIREITGQSAANIKVLLHRGRKKVADYISNNEVIRKDL
ncbi:RNA polymerase sigma factor [Chitinophaga sp. Cy-1792]|uniref:RNA polymerase sigma factor n=1 Tax=Chitinophaga sp. Cy-1792 TaxID=2608339 RepID=UPI00141F52F9|nr:sigma-70 family RNA polymerase sigma factor [Chitinophaga sp. Cy-1792]NIG53843.1 sigma-70 family RNA polymerase sigma factor [Chitinophaga sp. Cy-1792]